MGCRSAREGGHERMTRPATNTEGGGGAVGGAAARGADDTPPPRSCRRAHPIGRAATATSPQQAVFPVTVALSRRATRGGTEAPPSVAELEGPSQHPRLGCRDSRLCLSALGVLLVGPRGRLGGRVGVWTPGHSRLPRVWGPGPGAGCGEGGDFFRSFAHARTCMRDRMCFQPEAAGGDLRLGGPLFTSSDGG